ncbi:MAG TPA: TIGR03088 family PEP-CTERM/XrtA system glycosyltransferase [Albitalea sp.]|nr:TIGR03088 family PEP-CTERM/XrtA system glycosyltransferase [Albitalea sp.]
MSTETRPLILHVIHHLVTGGMENGLVSLINNLPESRFRHAVACIEDFSDFRGRLVRPGTEVYALHRARVGVWRLRRALFQLCRRLQPAIVHSRNQSGLDALLPARLSGVRHCIHGEHGWDVNDLFGTRLKPMLLRRLHSPLVDRYITVSDDLKRYLVDRVHVRPQRIATICNGVDTDKFRPVQRKPMELAPAGFLSAESVVVGTVGRTQPVKDQRSLILAFAELAHGDAVLKSKIRLIVVGDGPLRDELVRLADRLEIGAITWFVGDSPQVPELLKLFDVFVLPSLAEGISNTILEAMATGLPVIATRVGGNPQLVQDGVNGRLIATGDAVLLAGVLGDYLRSPALREHHGSASRRFAVEDFSLKSMLEKYQAEYENLLREA